MPSLGPFLRGVGCLVALVAVFVVGGRADAAPVRGKGKAAATEWKKGGTRDKARARALRRARLHALEQAIKSIEGSVDRQAKRALLKRGESWTGAYRVLSERGEGASVFVEVEVEVDVGRLAKRLTPRATGTASPLYRIAEVDAADSCKSAGEAVVPVLESMGVVAKDAKATELRASVKCAAVGFVPNTHSRAAFVSVVVQEGARTVVKAESAGFGASDETAIEHALGRALDDVAAELGQHRRGQVSVRVESPLPAARVRRLQRAMRESVIGISGSKVAGIDPDGAVRLHVDGNLAADTLAAKLGALSLPGFSLTIVGIDGPDALTIRLR